MKGCDAIGSFGHFIQMSRAILPTFPSGMIGVGMDV